MALKPGTINDFSNSMAKEMEDAFMATWPFVMHDAPVPVANDQMRLMFIAISKGLIEHLKKNSTSFIVNTTDNGVNTATGSVTSIL